MQERVVNEVSLQVYEHFNIDSNLITKSIRKAQRQESFAVRQELFIFEREEIIVQRRKELMNKRKQKLKESGVTSQGNQSQRSWDLTEVKELTQDETYEIFWFQQA